MKNPKIISFLFLLISFNAYSQSSIQGRIKDTYDYGVAFANVLLLKNSDSTLVKGAVTDEDGYYSLSAIEKGDYIIESYMVGFSRAYSPAIHLDNDTELTLEPLTLAEDVMKLEEVVVKADKPLYEMEMGKMVINVQSSITAAGQSAIDVLERSPGVFVNRQENSFSLGGKNGVIVLMNGKRSRMPIAAVYQMLEGLNAGDIEKIEIMTVPPANYDADGDAGFINIVMKKGAGAGTNGSFMANLGYGSGPRAGTSLSLNHQSGRISLYGNYSFNYTGQDQPFNMYRESTNDTESIFSSSEAFRQANRKAHNYQYGFDYQIGEKTIIGGLVSGYNNNWQMNSETIASFDYSLSPDTLINIHVGETNHWQHLMGNINLNHTFTEGSSLNANLDYLTYENANPTTYRDQYFDTQQISDRTEESRIFKDTPIKLWVANVDYSNNITNAIKLETGIKGTFSELVNDILFEEKINGNWSINKDFSNYADLSEDILAAFGSLKIKFDDKTTLNAGLRYEYTTTLLSTEEEEGVVDRKYGSFFPTLFFSRKINDINLIQLSYGRRITRPTFNEMAPWVLFVDPYTYFTGNANILPTFTNNVKADYSFKNFIFSVQYSHDKNLIMRFQPNLDPETNIMTLQTDNIDRSETVSTTFTLPFQITSWWEMQNNLNGFWQMIATEEEGEFYKRDQYGFQFNSTQTFKLPGKYTIELSGFYMSPVINGYFNWLSRGFLNLGVQKEFKNNTTLRISCNDIFETSQFRWQSPDNQEFSFHGNIRFDKRVFTVTFSQKFGNNKIKGVRKRSVGSEEELRRVTN
jgi:hypothetical protein